MNAAFDTDTEITTLESFLQKSVKADISVVPDIVELRAQAESLLKRLSSPVRTMIAGEFSAGKSTLTNLLVGERLIPTSVLASSLPPIVFRHGETVTASACWWAGREPMGFAGADFVALMAVNPDYIVLTAPNPILKRVSIFDTPGTSDPDRESEVLIELSGRAEMIIWCTNAVQAWRESERHMWTQLAPAVTRNGLMAVTHIDLPSVRQGYGRIMARLAKEVGTMFHAVLPIDSLSAMEAAPRGIVADEAAWTNSGGAALVKGVLDLASSIRKPELAAARKLISSRILPALEALRIKEMNTVTPTRVLRAGPKPVASAGPVEAKMAEPPAAPANVPLSVPVSMPVSVEDAIAAAIRPKLGPLAGLERPSTSPSSTPNSGAKMNPLAGLAKLKQKTKQNEDASLADRLPTDTPDGPASASVHPLMSDWRSKIEALIALVQSNSDPELSGFIHAASDTVMEMLETISLPGVLSPNLTWLLPQLQEALDTIILMQMESGDEPMEDAAMLLLQLSRDLALITAASD